MGHRLATGTCGTTREEQLEMGPSGLGLRNRGRSCRTRLGSGTERSSSRGTKASLGL